VLFTERSPSLINIHDPYQELVYCTSVRDVDQAWVAGEPVVAAGRVLGVDMGELLPQARELAVRLATVAGPDSELARPTCQDRGGAVTITLPDTDAVVEDGYVPVVSLAGLDDPARRAEIASQLGAALRRSGFYIAVDHIVPQSVFDQLTAAALAFFHQPQAKKARYGPSPDDATRRGFTSGYRAASGIGVNTDEDAAQAWALNPYDEGLGWRHLSVLEPRYRAAFVHPNRIPDMPGFRAAALSYFAAMESQILTLLALHALDLGLPTDHFTRLCAGAMTNLVINHYPPQRKDPLPDQSCLGPHTDLGIMTGLLHSGQRGLQVVDRENPTVWMPVPTVRGGLVVNAGDLMVLISGGRYRSALHRVVCTEEERVSVPVFMQPGPQTVIGPALPPPPGAEGFEPVRFGDYFAQRIGMMYAKPEH
jgi:isopenicillin N synthase-like dioxygenase